MDRIQTLVSQMTLEEKCNFLSGSDFWHTQPVERLGIPAVMVTDGPHGLRKQAESADHLGLNESVKSTCFPSGAGLASSWDRELLQEVGTAIGEEAQAEQIGAVLGPACNIKRSPLCGRNFEYFSEDPYLSSQIAKHHILGVQSQGVGTSIKHFCANNQETLRMRTDTIVDERTLREIYLASFEAAVKEAKPWTVMCSYNQVNGSFMSCNRRLLTDVLKDEWGYEGAVMTDWGAVKNRGDCAAAGLDLEMPGCPTRFNDEALEAVRSGRISEHALDQACERTLRFVLKAAEHQKEHASYSPEDHNHLARRAAAECMVLLKNEDGALPLNPGQRVALIGEFAVNPRYQGGGSSHINPHWTTAAAEEMNAYSTNVTYAQGFRLDCDEEDDVLVQEAVALAEKSDRVVVMAGLPDSYESEGYDRTHLRMPPNQTALIKRLAEVNKNVIVVLSNGSPVEMPWLADAKAVLEAYLGGQASGGAVADVLYGTVNPCGKLAETFPLRLEDTPSYLNFPCHDYTVDYREGIFVGYRYYDKKKLPVLFPFGHGLSYTSFAYTNLRVSQTALTDQEPITVQADITNTGKTVGKEVVQLYLAAKSEKLLRAPKELKGFAKVLLQPGETKTVTFELNPRSFAYYSETTKDWLVEACAYEIIVGGSSAAPALRTEILVTDARMPEKTLNRYSVMSELLEHPKGPAVLQPLMDQVSAQMGGTGGAITSQMLEAMIREMPLASMAVIAGDLFTDKQIEQILSALNEA